MISMNRNMCYCLEKYLQICKVLSSLYAHSYTQRLIGPMPKCEKARIYTSIVPVSRFQKMR